MEAGKLNRRISIQSKVITADADGYPTETWTTVNSPMANIITTGGKEFYAAQKLNAETSCLFCIRYQTGVTVKNRVLYGTRTFDILSVNNVNEANVELQISAKELVDGG